MGEAMTEGSDVSEKTTTDEQGGDGAAPGKTVGEYAAEYIKRGRAVCRLRPGEKRPMYNGWNLESLRPEDFHDGDSIGIIAGRRSGDLVCVDLDSPEALTRADDFLPPTGMVEGRPGKPRSHRWYKVTDIPEAWTSKKASGGIGGPLKTSFKHTETKKTIIDFIGTGGQAAVPPSGHPSGERRVWDDDGEPATLPMMQLWEAVNKLAEASGGQPARRFRKKRADRGPRKERDRRPARPHAAPVGLLPLDERVRLGERFVETCPLARSGHGGHDATFRVARSLRNDLALPKDVGRPLMDRYDERLDEAGEETWSASELDHKWDTAGAHNPEYPYGCKATAPGRANDPDRLARSFIEKCPWAFWRGAYYEYDGRRYREVPLQELRALLTGHIGQCLHNAYAEQLRRHQDALRHYEQAHAGLDGDLPARHLPRPPAPPSVTSSLVSNALQALESQTVLRGGDVPLPSLLPGGEKVNLLALENGLLDLDREELRPHTPAWFSTVCLPYPYDAAATCPRWLAVLGQNLEADAERIALLQEFFGYCLTPSTDAQQCIVLAGEGANGKSVVVAGLQALLGEDNFSSVPLEDFGRRFAMAQTLGKLANIAAEVGELDRTAEGTLKAFISGDRMCFERKGKDAFTARPTARLLLSTNNVPRFADRSEGVWRRLRLVPFNRRVPEGERVPGMDKPEWWLRLGEVPGMLNWALEGLRRLRANNMRFTEPAACRAALEAHRQESDPCRVFLLEHYEPAAGGEPIPSTELYKHYQEWGKENGHANLLTSHNFGRQVRRVFRLAESRTRRCGRGEKPQRFWFGLVRQAG
jgi:P4 family phage/plasmid primase-like protien